MPRSPPAKRIAFDEHSWVEVVHDWRSGSEKLFDLLATGVPWKSIYRNGHDSTGWHRDRFACRQPCCVVPVLTLGATRRFLTKPRAGGRSITFTPRSGDLIVMGGRSQQDWVHGVPKSPGTPDARISVNFQSSAQARR